VEVGAASSPGGSDREARLRSRNAAEPSGQEARDVVAREPVLDGGLEAAGMGIPARWKAGVGE
jgi:hypothetical protein